MSSGGDPVYHLRPHKAVDRNLFIETLLHLRQIESLVDYRYIGFGSYEFDDFKLIHRSLGVTDLHSIEKDVDVYKRQRFNRPYSFVKLFNTSCSEYFDLHFDGNKHAIVWADFSEASNKYDQCLDIVNICSKLQSDDILRITFNANPASIQTGKSAAVLATLDKEERNRLRFDSIKNALGDFFPKNSAKKKYDEKDVENKTYPSLLLEVIRIAVFKGLPNHLSAYPICSYVYRDGVQMLTVTILICSKNGRGQKLKEMKTAFRDWRKYVNIGSWKEPIMINLPPLTVHEQLEIRQLAKSKNGFDRITKKTGIDKESVKSYLLFSNYYPNYQPVTM